MAAIKSENDHKCGKPNFRNKWECETHVRDVCTVRVKPTIHYSQTSRIGDEIIFLPNKILLAKARRTCCCTLFVVRCQFSRGRRFFFDKKIHCVPRRDRYPNANPAYSVQRKTCSRNMANTFYTLFAVRRFFVVSPLFRCCSRIVYSGLKRL